MKNTRTRGEWNPEEPLGREDAEAPGWRCRALNQAARNAELTRVFKRLLRSTPVEKGSGLTEHYHRMLKKAGEAEASCYFVSFSHARRMLGRLRKMTPETARRTGNGKWAELMERTEALKKQQGLTENQALTRVLCDGRASSFFLGEWGVKHALRAHRRSSSQRNRPRRNEKGGEEECS